MPLLHRGLLELVSEVEKQRLVEASGVAWEDGLYLPRDWQPFSPFRWGSMDVDGVGVVQWHMPMCWYLPTTRGRSHSAGCVPSRCPNPDPQGGEPERLFTMPVHPRCR